MSLGQVLPQEFMKFCDDVGSSSTVYFIKDCNILLKMLTGDDCISKTCEELLLRLMRKDDVQNSLSTKSKGKKGKGKETACKYLKTKVCL